MLKNILLKLMNCLSVLIILFSIFILMTVLLTRSGEAPSFMGFSFFHVLTGSMEPNIPVDSLIIVKRVQPSELEIGDVISFYSKDPALKGAVNTHRIVAIEKSNGEYLFKTKGDANRLEDDYATLQKDVIGKVIYSSKTLGKMVRLLSNPLLFMPLIFIPLVILLGHSLWEGISLAKKIAKEEEEAAVREAVEAIRQKQMTESNEQKENEQNGRTN